MDPNYLPPHYREEYRLAIDALVQNGVEGYYEFLQSVNVVDFLSQIEIEHIKRTVQSPQTLQAPTGSLPELTYHQPDQDGSSDTYWPLHSDLDAPGLDLGWPLPQHSFVGPTEVTTLVNPSDPEMPSIKEQARRLIKNAQQVIAVVMDVFTDIDIFADLLDAAARHVPVYILLDEQNSHHFVSMVNSCKVNLEMIHMIRVRTVTGVTYFCRTGQSFKGQVMDRFLLTDCRAVLSGNYSFMWSFEKIHRSIAHLFLGELVSTFDEEFRILFANSQPLVVENALVPSDAGSGFLSNQFGLKRTQSLRQPRAFFRHAEHSSYSFDRMDSGLPFRRDDPFRHTMELSAPGLQIGKYSSQQFRMQQGYLEQGRAIMSSQQMERSAFKRHSYAEGTQESYSSSRLFMKQRVMSNLEEMEQHSYQEKHMYQAEGQGCYEQLRSRALQQTEEQMDSGYMPEIEPPSDYNVLSSDDLNPGQSHPLAGHYDPRSNKRPTVGQSYACQRSPTQPHGPDQKPWSKKDNAGDKDANVKQGMRDWRVNSYLSGIDDAGEECSQEPLGPDAFEDIPQDYDGRSHGMDAPMPYHKENSGNPHRPKLDIRPRYGKPIMPDRNVAKDGSNDLTTSDMESGMKPSDSLSSLGTEGEVEPREFGLSRHESFRTRINPMLQRSSRLRSSLIFSSSKLETHNTPKGEESDKIKTSSIVAEILEKRRSLSREPFDWNKHKKTKELDSADPKDSETKVKETSEKSTDEVKEEAKDETHRQKEASSTVVETDACAKPEVKSSSLNMNDPESRLLYFKELAAKRKANRAASDSSENKVQEPALKKTEPRNSDKLPEVTVTKVDPIITAPEPTKTQRGNLSVSAAKPNPAQLNTDKLGRGSEAKKEEASEVKKDLGGTKTLKPFPSPKIFKKDPLKSFKSSSLSRRVSCEEDLLTDATDAEKSEMKKSRSQSSSSVPHPESREGYGLSRQGSNTSLNTLNADGKDTKALDFLKKQTQRLKGFLGPKGEKKAQGATTSDNKSMRTVPEVKESTNDSSTDNLGGSTDNQKTANKPAQSRYQSSTSGVLYSSNLRDDTKVILEQISANSQKNRLELAKQVEASESEDGSEDTTQTSNLERESSLRYQSRNRFNRAPSNPQERDSLLKRIESMRKEKKVYSRFEV